MQPAAGNYQTLINAALRAFVETRRESLEATLRRVLREELPPRGRPWPVMTGRGRSRIAIPIAVLNTGSAYWTVTDVEDWPVSPRAPRRGEVYWVNLDPVVGSEIGKTRPAVIVSNDSCNRYGTRVVVLPITSNVESL
jgi:hypothetical protein